MRTFEEIGHPCGDDVRAKLRGPDSRLPLSRHQAMLVALRTSAVGFVRTLISHEGL